MVDWCCMCQCSGETLDHLLIHCKNDYQLWCFVLSSRVSSTFIFLYFLATS